MLLKRPFSFGFSIIALITLQVGISFFSVRFFLQHDLILAFVCFLIVPFLALLVGFYFVWFRQQRKVRSLK